MGVGTQGEACVVVAQHGGDGFHIYAVLQRHGSERVPEICRCQAQTKKFLDNYIEK